MSCSENKRIIKIVSSEPIFENNETCRLDHLKLSVMAKSARLKSSLELNQNVLYFSKKDKRFLVRTNELRAG